MGLFIDFSLPYRYFKESPTFTNLLIISQQNYHKSDIKTYNFQSVTISQLIHCIDDLELAGLLGRGS